MIKIKVVIATRKDQSQFITQTATGRSLSIYGFSFMEIRLFPGNKLGLPQVYNQVIEECINDPCILVFMHDDLHILDYFWADQIINGLQHFQILGVAGNKRRVPYQPGWAFIDDKFTWDDPVNLSGVVGHGRQFPPETLSVFGPSGQKAMLLDGVFMACHSQTLHIHSVRFEEQFKFHFYDLDICRQAEMKGLACGTWPISLIHESGGAFGTPEWNAGYQAYIKKWGM